MEIPQRCDIASGLDVSGKSDLPNLIYLAYLHFNGSLPKRVIVSSRWTTAVLLSRSHSSAHLSVFINVQDGSTAQCASTRASYPPEETTSAF